MVEQSIKINDEHLQNHRSSFRLEIQEDTKSRLSRHSTLSGIGLNCLANPSWIQSKYFDEQARIVRVPLRGKVSDKAGKFGQPTFNYFTKVLIGMPPQEFSIQFDLSLNDHFVPRYSKQLWGNTMRYNQGYSVKRSETGCKTEDRYLLNYQNCQLFGTLSEDNIKLETLVTTKVQSILKVKLSTIAIRQEFLTVDYCDKDYFLRQPVHGFFGLGPANSRRNITRKLQDSSHINQLIFSLWLDRQSLSGQILFGGADQSRFKGNIYWHDSREDKWSVPIYSLKIGSHILDQVKPCIASLSSGVPEIFGPASTVEKIYNIIGARQDPATGLVWIKETKYAKLPDILISTDKVEIIIEPSSYVGKQKGRYYLNILPGSSDKEWTFGLIFLHNVYTIFDMSTSRVGLARREFHIETHLREIDSSPCFEISDRLI